MGFQRRYDPGIRAIRNDDRKRRVWAPPSSSGPRPTIRLPPPIDYIPRIGRNLQGLPDPRHRCGPLRDRSGDRRCRPHSGARSAIPTSPPRVTLAPRPQSSSCRKAPSARSRDCASIRWDTTFVSRRTDPELAVAAGWSERTPIVSTEPGVPPPGGPDRHVLGSLRFRIPGRARGFPPGGQR